jgi:hypothetical protein
MVRTAILAGVMLAGLPLHKARAAEFDGRWSVLVVTEKGACDRGYRYEVNVSGGKVKFAGNEAVGMDGTISPGGQVQMIVGRPGGAKGDGKATGSGKLSANAGRGIWHAAGSGGDCSGTWEAERR